MSREAVSQRICLAGAKTECGALRKLGVAAARMTRGDRAWTHAGILYRWGRGIRFFELKSHHELSDEPITDEPVRPSVLWVEPRIQPERAFLVATRCQLVARRHREKKIPYGFRYNRTSFDEQGIIRLGAGEVGLTCATIVDAVFASERLPLLDPNTWPPPDAEDKKTRRGVIADIRKRDREHADILEAEIEAPRIRPEEVVAAAAIHPTIGTFETLVDGAAAVTDRLGL